MILEEFIKGTLNSIINAVIQTQKEQEEAKGVRVNPPHTRDYRGRLCDVDFDIAVIATDGTETSGGLAANLGIIVMGSKGKSDQSNSSESRIKFKIPIDLPIQTDPHH